MLPNGFCAMKKKKEKGKKSVEANSTRLAMIIVFCSSEQTSQKLFFKHSIRYVFRYSVHFTLTDMNTAQHIYTVHFYFPHLEKQR